MLFGEVTPNEMRAAQVLSFGTMAAFIAAPLFRRHAGKVRAGILAVYILAIIAFVVYVLVVPASD